MIHILNEFAPYLILGLFILLLLTLYFVFNVNSRYDNLARKVREQASSISMNPTAYSLVASDNSANTKKIEEVLQKLADMSQRIAKLEQVKAQERTVVEKEVAVLVEVARADKIDITYYAKFPDAENGFTDRWLIQQQNGEQVYELILTPSEGKGTFYISEQRDVQQYALSDINYYLAKGCEFLNQPGKSSAIRLVEAGTLTWSDEVWVIEEKIKIEFV